MLVVLEGSNSDVGVVGGGGGVPHYVQIDTNFFYLFMFYQYPDQFMMFCVTQVVYWRRGKDNRRGSCQPPGFIRCAAKMSILSYFYAYVYSIRSNRVK